VRTRDVSIVIHELDGFMSLRASVLSFREKITFYDAAYLALARNLDATFLTADIELIAQLSEEARSGTKLLKEYPLASSI